MPTAKSEKVRTGPGQRFAFRVARRLLRLPPGLQRRLAGGGRVQRDGLELDPALQLLLATDRRMASAWPEDALRLRRERDRAAVAFRGPLPYVHAVRDLTVPGAAGPLAARLYATENANAPLLVYFHGGGFVFGNLETHDPGCRLLCQHGKLNVLAVEYRLVPEHRFPHAIEDAQAAFAWAVAHAPELGADGARVGVGGDSAGANLAAVVSLLAKDAPVKPKGQLLFYPPTDRSRAHPSMDSLADGFMLTRSAVSWFHAQYAEVVSAKVTDPRISPLLAGDFHGVPPAIVVTAGFDPLRDEGRAYGEALREAGVPVVLRQYDALIHGFFNFTGLHDPSRDAVCEVARLTRDLLTGGTPNVGPRVAPPSRL